MSDGRERTSEHRCLEGTGNPARRFAIGFCQIIMLDVTIYLVCALSAGLAALLLLPMVVAVQARRTDHPGAMAFRLDGALFGGLIGVSLHQSGGTRRLYPLWHRWTIGRGHVLGERVREGGTEPETAQAGRSSSDAAVDADTDQQDEPALDEAGRRYSISQLRTLVERGREMSRLLARPGLQLLRSLRHVASLRRLTLRGHLGLADPAATGSACALLLGVRAFNAKRVKIDIAPDFVTPRAEGHAHLVVHLHLGYALACIVRFGLRVGLGWLVLRVRKIAIPGFQAR